VSDQRRFHDRRHAGRLLAARLGAYARRARARYACFDHFGGDVRHYARTAGLGVTESCEREVVGQLLELRCSASEYARRDGRVAADELFFVEQNARLVKNAEAYYRSMFRGRAASWNLRDRHMVETLDALVEHLRAQRRRAVKVVVWAHNSHFGDARATELGRRGESNVGQLVREGHDDDAVLVGFTTYSGTVTAAADWDEPAERKTVRPALPDSYEAAFHAVGVGNFTLDLRGRNEATAVLAAPRLERAIGVIYRPETERQSHYFEAVLPRQFDVLLHYDHTRAVEPLERTPIWERGEVPETVPLGPVVGSVMTGGIHEPLTSLGAGDPWSLGPCRLDRARARRHRSRHPHRPALDSERRPMDLNHVVAAAEAGHGLAPAAERAGNPEHPWLGERAC